MAKTNRRYAKKGRQEKKINLLHIDDGVYLDETSYGTIHKMSFNYQSIFHVAEYMYSGTLHQGNIRFLIGEDLKEVAPVLEDYNHGFTLEGAAKEIFKVENSLNIYSPIEKRIFSYVNGKSVLKFVGDPSKSYDLYIRIYDNANGYNNDRWVVLYAEESK